MYVCMYVCMNYILEIFVINWFRVMNSFVDCITDVAGMCGEEVRVWQLEMTRLAREPSMTLEECILGKNNQTYVIIQIII